MWALTLEFYNHLGNEMYYYLPLFISEIECQTYADIISSILIHSDSTSIVRIDCELI